MAEVSLNTEEEREDELQTQAVEPVPQVEAVQETIPTPPPQKEAQIEGLAVDPYSKASESQMRGLFQYRPEVLGMTREPLVSRSVEGEEQVPVGEPIQTGVGALDELSAQQERLLGQAETFFTLDYEERAFPENATLEQKYRILLRSQGGYLPLLDENGMEVRDELGVAELFPLTTTREYERYTTPRPTDNIVETAKDIGYRAITTIAGEAGRGDLADLDKQLIEMGMTNQVARTLALRGVATGRYSEEAVTKQLQDLKVFALSIPQYAAMGASFLTTEVVMNALEAGGMEFQKGPEGQTAQENVQRQFQSLTDMLDIAKHIGVETTIENMAGDIYNPEVIEEIIAPRGLNQAIQAYGGPEIALYAVWGTMKAVTAARRIPALKKHMLDTFGTEDLVEAFAKARSQGMSPATVITKYTETAVGQKAQNKLAKDLDIAFGMMVRRPGEARKEFLQEEYDGIRGQIRATLETLRAARATGKTDVVKRQQKVLVGLRQRQNAFLHKNMVPKYYRDLYAEAGMTVGATVAFTQLTQQFFGYKQSEQFPIELGGALSIAIPFGKFGTTADMAGAGIRATGNVLLEMANLVKNFGDLEAIKAGRADLKLSREAYKVLRKVTEQPSEFQNEFIRSLQKHAEYKNRLVELSARTGVDINEDLMVSNLAIMSNMAELIDVSRQLDEKIAATGLDDITGPMIQNREVIGAQHDLISQLAISTQKLLDVKLKANLADDDPLSILADQMREFVLANSQRLKGDREHLASLVKTNREAIKARMEIDYIDGDEAQAATTRLFQEQYETSIEAIMDDMTDDAVGLVLEPQKGVQQRLARLDELREEQFQMLNQITRGLRPEEAAMGRAGGHFANLVAYNRNVIDSEVAKRYVEFDSQNPGVYANIAQQFDYFMNANVENFDDILQPDFVLQATEKLGGAKIIPSDRKGLANMFSGAAKRGLEMMNTRTQGQLNRIITENELDGLPPIQQWMELKRLAKEEPEKLAIGGVDGELMVNNMPLLVNTAEWRRVNKFLGKSMRKSTDEQKNKGYRQLYDQWQLVSKQTDAEGNPNRGAWMEGWIDGTTVRPVADEVYGQFRSIQDYYMQEVIERYTVDKTIKGWDASLTGKTKGAATGPMSTLEGVEQDELLQEFLKTFDRVDEANMPTQWLNQLLARVTKMSNQAGVPLSGMDLKTDNLYNAVAGTLGKIGGVYDKKTGQYFLLGKSGGGANDEIAVETQKQLKAILTRHLQGVLVKNFDQVLKRDAKGRIIFQPNLKVEYDKNTFDTLFNIPVYTRNEAGDVVPLMEDGVPVKLLDEEEVFSAINLNALERNREDLKEVFDEANSYVNTIEDEVIGEMTKRGPRGEAVGIEELAKQEIQFVQDLQGVLFRQRPGSEVRQFNKAQMDETIYNRFIMDDNSKEFERLRQNLISEGYDAEYVDQAIAKSVQDHIIAKTQKYTGNKESVGADGVTVNKKQYAVSSDEIIKMLGDPDSSTRRRLETYLGEDVVESWELIAEVIRKVDPPPANSGIDAHVSSMSLDSVLSRIYNINRGVVSVQWVATESIIRASRQHSGALLRAMLKDREVARKVLEIVETNKVPEYKVEPKWLRILMSEVVMAEVRNENAATDKFASYYYGFTGLPESPTPEVRTQAAPTGVQADVAAIAERNERLAEIEQIEDPRERARARMQLQGVGEAPPEEEEVLTQVEKDFRALGLSTKPFQTQGAQQ